MNGNGKRPAGSADRMVNAIIAIVILAVLGVAVYAVYGRVSKNLETKAITEGRKEATIRYLAEQQGMSVKEFFAEYGLENSGLSGSEPISEMYGKMTVENFAKYSGEDLDTFLEEYQLKDKVSADDLWEDAELKLPLSVYVGSEEYVDSFKEFYGLDESVNKDTPWGDVKDIVEQKQEELANATVEPIEEVPADDAAQEADDTEAETDASETEAEDTEAQTAE